MISGISFSTIAHATEDLAKVTSAVLNMLPETMRGNKTLESAEAKGHHGNEISVLTLEIRDKNEAKEAVGYIIRSLPVGDRLRIRDRINVFYDGKSSIFLRVDKQQAFLNSLRLSDGDDVIRIKISILAWKSDISFILGLFDLS